MEAISTKTLTPDIRNEITRDLVTHIFGFVKKPTSQFCKFVAQRLILKYPFMRDEKGTVYVNICTVKIALIYILFDLLSVHLHLRHCIQLQNPSGSL